MVSTRGPVFTSGPAVTVPGVSMMPRVLSAAGRAEEAKTGVAMPDGSYPIPNVDYLHKAIRSYGRASDPTAVRRHIIARAEALGRSDLIPPHWRP